MGYENIAWELLDEGQIAVITLNRPSRMNALSIATLDELLAAVKAIDADPTIRVWLIRGGPRADGRPCFSAGVDLKEASAGLPYDPRVGPELTDLIDEMLKPSIAVIDGVCTTGAGEIAVSCDIRIVGEGAQISDWHLKNLGVGTGGWGASTRWSRLVGPAKTKEMFLTGKVMGAAEAVTCGWATSMHPSAELWDAALAMARAIAAMRPEGVRVTLAHIDHTAEMSKEEALRWAPMMRKWLGVNTNMAESGRAVMGARPNDEA